MSIETPPKIMVSLVFMNEEKRTSTQRSYCYHERISSFPAEYEKTQKMNGNLVGELGGVSASHQFSSREIEDLTHCFSSSKFTIVNLREETHFFLNGVAVSLTNEHNNPNQGKKLSEIHEEEKELLETLKQEQEITLHTRKKEKEMINGVKTKKILFFAQEPTPVKNIETEEMVVSRLNGTYIRVPITDYSFPLTEQIDELICLYDKQKKENSWVHFHCAAGRGRSSIALAMFAILNWAENCSLEEIFTHLESRGNVKLLKPVKEGKPVKKRSDLLFWQQFYSFVQKRSPGTTWSAWEKASQLAPYTICEK